VVRNGGIDGGCAEGEPCEPAVRAGEGDDWEWVENGLGCRVRFRSPSKGLMNNRDTYHWLPDIAF